MSLNPVEVTEEIKKRYLGYLKTTFHVDDPEISSLFHERLEKKECIKGPILEITPPYKTGSSLEDLIREGVVSPLFRDLNQKQLPLSRPLYLHQEQALRKTISDGQNIVVATGTGSGKTEIFMLTILNELFRQKEAGTLDSGVRALLLYPMNALVNDQLKRMRSLLATAPDITFGRYTGETPEKQKKAVEQHRNLHGSDPLPNELVSREEMRTSPPHILLTNYAMLEYLLLRPSDNVFFDGDHADSWQFIVLDEAHTYNGAKGIEMAMLLRRLKDRVTESREGVLRCIATSATIGGGTDDYPAVAAFATNIFGEPFFEEGIVTAERKNLIHDDCWGKPDPMCYPAWQEVVSPGGDVRQALAETGRQYGIPDRVLQDAESRSDGNSAFLYHVLSGDAHVMAAKSLFSSSPAALDAAAEMLFSGEEDKQQMLVALVDLAGQATVEGSDPLLPARYHLFVRSVEGAYIQFYPTPQIFLEPITRNASDGAPPVFELGVCKYCGAPYIVGKIERKGPNAVLKQAIQSYYDEDDTRVHYFLLKKSVLSENENEDDSIELNSDIVIKGIEYTLCTQCGALDKANRVRPSCTCGEECRIPVIEIEYSGETLHKCPVCTRLSPGNAVVGRFLMGKDAIPSVLATAIYQQLPDIAVEAKTNPVPKNDDPWAQTPAPVASASSKRNLLIFSDSRQDAAFFAPYLMQTYNKILRRSLIIEALEENRDAIFQNEWRITDLIPPLQKKAKQLDLFPDSTPQEVQNELARWVLYEFSVAGAAGSLESLGLCGFTLMRPDGFCTPAPLLREPWNLTDDEAWTLFQILLDSFRKDGALHFPNGISPEDEFFQPRNFQFYFTQRNGKRAEHILAWTPQSGYSNRRLDYLKRLARVKGASVSDDECRAVLDGIWKFCAPADPSSCFNGYFVQERSGRQQEPAYLMEPKRWRICADDAGAPVRWYYCSRCQTLTPYTINNVCPTYRCEGTLRPVDPEALFASDHYLRLYREMRPVPLRAEEHTAQLTNDRASRLQQEFIRGKVNVLSCSTTFELGVDVGELESVFMRNMPPSAANYIQRAGRAGRRLESNAFVTTFCQRRSHDLTQFKDPMPFVQGIIAPPHCDIRNEKIVKRHIYATAIASFWMDHPETFKNVREFFFDETDGPALLKAYLDAHPEDLMEALQRIVPPAVQDAIRLSDWEFVDDLFSVDDADPDKGLMVRAADAVRSDVDALDEIRMENVQKGLRSDYLFRLIRTIKNKPIINFLSSSNILPKYGFPVDVVEFKIMYPSDEADHLQLDRDLAIAISEYAPGSQIVAAGNVWESRYIKRVPKHEWRMYDYIICDTCHRYNRVLSELQQDLVECESCHHMITRRSRKFIIPEFGFLSENKKPRSVREKRPKKTYSSRAYYSGESVPGTELEISLAGGYAVRAESASHGRLGIINNAGGAGFHVCQSCGYTVYGNEAIPKSHSTATGRPCTGRFIHNVDLGHEYLTDILLIEFVGYDNRDEGFWLSLLYAMLEGISAALDISRDDLDGALYPIRGKLSEPALVLFDTIPGGAGQVVRAIEDEETLRRVLFAAWENLDSCTCGGESGSASCYGCLKNYSNQFCHEQLERGKVLEFFALMGIGK